jgi:TonB family protein
MINDLIAFTQAITDYALLLSCQLVLILVARKPVLKLFGAIHAYRLWLLPALWAPLYFLDWSWVQAGVVPTWVTDTVATVPVNLMSSAVQWLPDRVAGPLPTAHDEVVVMAATTRSINWQAVFAGLWLAGVLALLTRQALRWRFFLSHIHVYGVPVPERERSAITERVTISARVPLYMLAGHRSPALLGVIKPMLLLPADFMAAYDSDQRHLILSHESVHLQRRDNLWNLCAWSLKVIFWFNPLAHLAYRYYRADQELSCDALALAHSSASQRRRYAATLLECLDRSGTSHYFPLMTAWGSLNSIKERTAMIKRYSRCKARPRLLRVSLLTLVLSGAGTTALMTATLSLPALAADAAPTAIPVDRTLLSTAVNDATDRIAELIGEHEFAAAESELNELRSLELNDQERFLIGRLTGDVALGRRDAVAAIAAYSSIQDLSGLNQLQREDALLHLGDAQIAGKFQYYKDALASYRQLSEMAGGRNPGYLYRIGVALHRLKQIDESRVAVQDAIAAYGDKAPRSAYMLLWHLTTDLEAKRQVHETMIEKFQNPQDVGRLAYSTRDDGSYDPGILGSPFLPLLRSPLFAVITPDTIGFSSPGQPLAFVQPVYPEEARHKGIEGSTTLVFELDSNGNVINPVILNSVPDGTFDEATLATVAQFRFDRSTFVRRMRYTLTYCIPSAGMTPATDGVLPACTQ